MKSITKTTIDQWMFQNVEGKLSSQQAEQLSTYIISNPKLENEFNNWNNAHVRNIQIEQYKNINSIIKRKGFAWKNRYTFLLGLLLGATFWMPFAFKSNNEVVHLKKISLKVVVKKDLIKAAKIKEVAFKHDEVKIVIKNKKTGNTIVLKNRGEVQEVIVKNKNIELITCRDVAVINKSILKRKLNARKVFCRPEKTKKQLRIERRKARRNARKPEIKYAKGKGPGVIPMSDLGF